jgi:adenylate kinase
MKGGKYNCLRPPKQPPSGTPSRIILLGAPGVGKGTQAELLCARLCSCRLCTDDVFHAAKITAANELSMAMKNAIDHVQRGDPVSDETVLNLVIERLKCLHCSGGFLLDGFPRTVAQAKALEQLLENHQVKLTAVLNCELAADKIIARVSARRTCSSCAAVYHDATHPPKITKIYDKCGSKLIQSMDDYPEAIKV